jgi:hypothetical protein
LHSVWHHIYSDIFLKISTMADRNSKESRQGNTSANRNEQPIKGSGQQTGGERGQKIEKGNKEGYRSSEQKRQKGNSGGNR